MKTLKKDDKIESLPLDMVIVILTKLPAKSLFKVRCVSKQWCSIIRSRSFIKSFMSVSLSRPPRILLGYGIERRTIFFSLPLDPQVISKHSSLVSKYDVPFNNNIGLCNSACGIICFSNGFDHDSVICNPTTKKVITIPNDPTEFDPENSTCSMCLGYDTSNDQYKILRTISSLREIRSTEHSVCTLRLGERSSFSSWRRVESGNGYYSLISDAIYINGVVYYGARENSSRRCVIVSFDVGSERLLLMEAPKENNYVRPINYQGKLGCFCFTTIDNVFSLWILEDAKKQIWSRTGFFPPSFCDSYRKLRLSIHGTTDAGEIIFVSQLFSGELFYYDLKKKNVIKSVRIGDIVEDDELSIDMHIASSCDHVENIISL